MHKITKLLLKGCYIITATFLIAAIILLLTVQSDTLNLGHTLMLVREMCATGAVILLLSVVGSAALHDRLGKQVQYFSRIGQINCFISIVIIISISGKVKCFAAINDADDNMIRQNLYSSARNSLRDRTVKQLILHDAFANDLHLQRFGFSAEPFFIFLNKCLNSDSHIFFNLLGRSADIHPGIEQTLKLFPAESEIRIRRDQIDQIIWESLLRHLLRKIKKGSALKPNL